MIAFCDYHFHHKHLIINNVKNRRLVERYCHLKKKQGLLMLITLPEDFSDEVMAHFGIVPGSFNGGYVYSISELLGIYKCETVFLLHFSSDSLLIRNNEWISTAISLMNSNEDYFVANPTWNLKFQEAENESFGQTADFYTGYGFSDQCYLIRKTDFDQQIYNEKNVLSERYPKYGGELFEKRVDAYMRNHHKFRLTHKRPRIYQQIFHPAGQTKDLQE